MCIELVEAAEDLAELLEATGEYYYEDVAVKRWILGDGGRSGNCEDCIEASDLGWIDMDDIFDPFDVDEPPGHPNCTCTMETKDTRKRVYA